MKLSQFIDLHMMLHLVEKLSILLLLDYVSVAPGVCDRVGLRVAAAGEAWLEAGGQLLVTEDVHGIRDVAVQLRH